MVKKIKTELRNENEKFVKDWEMIRNKGVRYYLLTKTTSAGIMMLSIYFINILFDKEMNYLLEGVIYGLITILAPVLSWGVNEKRYKSIKGI